MSARKVITRRTGGFTLVELLTVVAIIGLLVGMVVPTITAILKGVKQTRVDVRIQALENGCGSYKMSGTGNRYFPGQDPTHLNWLSSGTYANAGSALLARCLFWKPDGNYPYDTSRGEFPVSQYGTYAEDMLGKVNNVSNTIIDFDSEPMAILYYPARIGMQGDVYQFKAEDNTKYTDSTNVASSSSITTYAQSSSGGVIKNDGMYIITAAGSNRLYFDEE